MTTVPETMTTLQNQSKSSNKNTQNPKAVNQASHDCRNHNQMKPSDCDHQSIHQRINQIPEMVIERVQKCNIVIASFARRRECVS